MLLCKNEPLQDNLMDGLKTDRLYLRPIVKDDARDLEQIIFEDPQVVKGLAHDGSDPEVRRAFSESWSTFGPDGNFEFWQECKIGLYVITDPSGHLAPKNQFMGISGVFLEREHSKWNGEFFYALGSAFHGKGIMSEACHSVINCFKSVADAGSLYAVYWKLLNPASGKILSKLGFRTDGTQSLLNEYEVGKIIGIRNFELWRLSCTSEQDIPTVIEEVSIKLGHMESEGVSSRDENISDILDALPTPRMVIDLEAKVEMALDLGKTTPAFSMMRFDV